MVDIDTAGFRREWAGCSGVAVPAEPDDSCFSCVVLTLCDEIDRLRIADDVYRHMEQRAMEAEREWSKAEAKLAAVRALIPAELGDPRGDYVDAADLRDVTDGRPTVADPMDRGYDPAYYDFWSAQVDRLTARLAEVERAAVDGPAECAHHFVDGICIRCKNVGQL